jgi:hypothetical protein
MLFSTLVSKLFGVKMESGIHREGTMAGRDFIKKYRRIWEKIVDITRETRKDSKGEVSVVLILGRF